MHYDLPFKASSLMVFGERAKGISHEIEYLASVQRGQIIGAAMCLHTYHRALKMKNASIKKSV